MDPAVPRTVLAKTNIEPEKGRAVEENRSNLAYSEDARALRAQDDTSCERVIQAPEIALDPDEGPSPSRWHSRVACSPAVHMPGRGPTSGYPSGPSVPS